MHFINLSGYLAASVQIKPVEPVEKTPKQSRVGEVRVPSVYGG